MQISEAAREPAPRSAGRKLIAPPRAPLDDDGIILLPSAARREMRCDGCIRTRVKVELYKTIKAELLTSAIICLRAPKCHSYGGGFLKGSRRETHLMLTPTSGRERTFVVMLHTSKKFNSQTDLEVL
jgi:hypothetical protein